MDLLKRGEVDSGGDGVFTLNTMSDMTDMTEHMPVAADADGGDQLVDDGGVVALLIQETTETEVVFDKGETLPNHENSANPVTCSG